jgi:hypothetical protein
VLTVKSGMDPHMINSMKDGTYKLAHYTLWFLCIFYVGLVYTYTC